jgi:hypothetical protein
MGVDQLILHPIGLVERELTSAGSDPEFQF